MLNNMECRDNLRGLARIKGRDYDIKTVNPLLLDEAIGEGWSVVRKNNCSVRVRRAKALGLEFEDRVWSLLYRMGFNNLSGGGGARLTLNAKDPNSPVTLIDVAAIDDEVGVAIECKSAQSLTKRPQFQEELGKHALARQQFARSVSHQYPSSFKRQVAMAMFTRNIALSENDRKRALEAQVVLFNNEDLSYYEELISHLGPAAKFQFLADLLPGKHVPGLQLRVPAIKTKMGPFNCYSFSVSPEYLLKIAYVSHRSKGKASDVNTYQRMIRKSRLKAIGEYINQDGIFPTNIVISLDQKPRFDRGVQEGDSDAGVFGWLDLRPAYKTAWIIDGQHRLFAYSGHARASNAKLSVLAFEGLPPSKQAQLFIDINAEQKSVKQSLLQELYAELHWNAGDPAARVRAVIAKVIQGVNADPSSPLHGRILATDQRRDDLRCISMTALFRALDSPDLFVSPTARPGVMAYGPLWAGDSNEAMRDRSISVLRNWFEVVREGAPDWWSIGAGEGGGLSMNDSVVACINVLRSVFQHIETNGERLVELDDDDLSERVRQYAEVLGSYLGSLSEEERKYFREWRGIQGQTTRTRLCQQAIHQRIPDFKPPGLQDYMDTAKAQTNIKAKLIVDRIEAALQKVVVQELKGEFGLDETQWWIQGVPRNVRLKVMERHEDDDGARGGREHYFDLINYRSIATSNWNLLGPIVGRGSATMSKDKRTSWIVELNDIRKVVSHSSAGRAVSIEQLAQLEEYESWLSNSIREAV